MLITVTLDAPDDWNDHAKLFDRGFSLMEARILARIGEFSYTVPVLNSENDTVKVTNTEDFSIITNKSDSDVTTDVVLPRYAIAPIEKGQLLGKVIFYQNGEIIGEIPLIAENEALKRDRDGFFRHFKK
jgi:D-alanyl-D-alanine carboxypeptidase/D-alanyl-D-alanine carboxypeptidase (penicillin-binding protein 5/6)